MQNLPMAKQSEKLNTQYQECGCSVVLVTSEPLVNWKIVNKRPCELISTVIIDILA